MRIKIIFLVIATLLAGCSYNKKNSYRTKDIQSIYDQKLSKIIRTDGEAIGWKESFLRYSINLALTLFRIVMMTVCILQADDAVYTSLGWQRQAQYLMSLSPTFFRVHTRISNIWFYSELIVLLTNDRKRAIHDFIAGTVIVKAKYIDKIREAMNSVPADRDSTKDEQLI